MKPIDPEGLCEELHAALVSELEDAIPNAQAVGDHIDALIMGRLGWAAAKRHCPKCGDEAGPARVLPSDCYACDGCGAVFRVQPASMAPAEPDCDYELREAIDDELGWADAESEERGDYVARIREVGALLKAHAGGATVSERERVSSAVEVTVEEWEALEDCVSTDRGQYDANTRLLAGKALRKLNARAALSKSETTQPATGDGTGEDEDGARRMYERLASARGWDDPWATRNEDTKRFYADAYRFARNIGAQAGAEEMDRAHTARKNEDIARCVTEIAELKEKLAAAETLAHDTAVLLENEQRDHDETRGYRQHAEQRAEKAEARVEETLIALGALGWATPSEQFPGDGREVSAISGDGDIRLAIYDGTDWWDTGRGNRFEAVAWAEKETTEAKA